MTESTSKSTVAFDASVSTYPADAQGETSAFESASPFSLRQSSPPWLGKVDSKLEALGTLEENWDSYGALPIDLLSISMARQFIEYLSIFAEVNAPSVGATPDGHVGFSWDERDWSLDAEVLPDKRVEYVYLDERDSMKDREATTWHWVELLELLTQGD